MKGSVLAVALVVIFLVVVAGFYYVSTMSGTGGTTSTSSSPVGASGGVQITSDNVTKTAIAGTWQIALKNTGSVPVTSITVFLYTPTRAFICSGAASTDGLFFKNCPAPANGNPLPPNATVSGSSTGAGPMSGTVGTAYPVDVHLAFASGQTSWVNSTVTVRSG
jgi:hypothetical protein